ncbi:hypothetical protein EES43_20590 [Streptomyces sp. ADI96-02]|nr:hypothetical protein EES43_20590 [Streptomyces sp. ADI96-02]
MSRLTPITQSIFCCHISSDPVSPSPPTYQTAAWSSASAVTAATIQRPAVRHSWITRALPYFGGFTGGGPPAQRWATRASTHLTVEWPSPTVKPM